MAESKTCTACKKSLPFSDFANSKQGRYGLKAECRECVKKRDAAYRENRREALREYKKKWRKTSDKAINEKKSPSQSKERVLARSLQWQKDNPGKAGARNARRRSAKLAAVVAWANKDAIEKMYDTAKAKTNETGFQWHVDHIVPLKSKIVCGLHCEANLRVIPGTENCAKKNIFWPDMP